METDERSLRSRELAHAAALRVAIMGLVKDLCDLAQALPGALDLDLLPPWLDVGVGLASAVLALCKIGVKRGERERERARAEEEERKKREENGKEDRWMRGAAGGKGVQAGGGAVTGPPASSASGAAASGSSGGPSVG